MAISHNNKDRSLSFLTSVATHEEIARVRPIRAQEVQEALQTIDDFGFQDENRAFKFQQRLRWAYVTVKYYAGNRNKEVVCAHIARTASLLVVKGSNKRPNKARYAKHVLTPPELFSVGYEAALKAWDEYDPKKDRGNGIDGFLFSRAEGHIRNAAAEMTNRLNIRAHDKDEVLPTVYSHLAYKDDGLGSAGVTPRKHLPDTDYDVGLDKANFTEAALVSGPGGPEDASVIAAAELSDSESQDGDSSSPWIRRSIAAAEASSARTEGSVQDAHDRLLFDLIEKILSKEDSELLMSHFGVLGQRKESIETMSQRLGLSHSSMRRRIEAIKQSFMGQARRDNPEMTALPETYGLHLEKERHATRIKRKADIESHPLLPVKGALVRRRANLPSTISHKTPGATMYAHVKRRPHYDK